MSPGPKPQAAGGAGPGHGERAEVALAHASRLLNLGPTVLVTSAHLGRRNVMAAAWSMPVEFTPPRIAVVIDKSTFTRELVLASGVLGIDIPSAAQAALTYTVGSESGREQPRDGDKFMRYGIECFSGPVLGLPHVAGCLAWLEGRVIREARSEQAYDTFFVEVAWAAADPRVFAGGKWHFDAAHPELHTLHHLGGGTFVVPGRVVSAKKLAPARGR